MEGKVLLSAGLADPAATMHIAAATSFAMNGTLYPGIVGHYNPATHQETVVAIEGNAQPNFKPMGKNVALELVNLAHFTTIPVNRNVAHSQLPNIGDITLHLSNANGSLTVALAASDTNKYRFTVSGDTGQFTTATGTGTAVLTLAPRHYVLTFTQDKH